ncbi:peptidylprolyl isomerase [Bergeyella sp. RCAD1439]|uniref:peptidylprolyl isomerase n=1 Tax=Bergeyella anatis TaxID=3113737 RepID=UPI002E178B21|nr:peptidylprolyl isomerase [Bergeyella sp. RCAD1439]
MKKIAITASVLFSSLVFSQYMVVGKDSISLNDFKKENLYSLQNSGVERTLQTVQEFMLLQQLAAEKKVDTLSYFQNRMAQRAAELKEEYFYPKALVERYVKDYVRDNRTERNVLIFALQKKEGDRTDYRKVYEEVVSGRRTMEDAVKTYVGPQVGSMYLKPGVLAEELYGEIKTLPEGGYTRLHETNGYVTFAKLLANRPSLGYMIFGTLSFPNDAESANKKNEILEALASGKKFNEVTAQFGTTENEKNNGGVIMGSPTLPEEAYKLLKDKKVGETAGPILFGERYYFFHIYDLVPYEVTPQMFPLFKREMMASNYGDRLQQDLVDGLVHSSAYKGFPDYDKIKLSYAAFKDFKNQQAVLYSYGNHKGTFGDLKTDVEQGFQNLDSISNDEWRGLMDMRRDHFVMAAYQQDFETLPEVKKELDALRRMMYSEYIFSEYLKKEIENHPEWLTDYYNENRSAYRWDERAGGRIAIVADEKLVKGLQKQLKDRTQWEALKKKYEGQLNDKNQILVHFEEGKMPKDAEVFTKYGMPFKSGVYTTKIGDRTLVVAIDEIHPQMPMTQDEAKELLFDAVSERRIKQIVAEQRAKTNIVIDPAFRSDLEKNFKK